MTPEEALDRLSTGELVTILGDPVAAVVVRAGDQLVIGLRRDHLTQAEADDMRSRLRAGLPGVDFVIVAGVTGLAVRRPLDLPPGPGEDDTEVWIPPASDCIENRPDKPCPHCGGTGYHHRTRRCADCGRR